MSSSREHPRATTSRRFAPALIAALLVLGGCGKSEPEVAAADARITDAAQLDNRIRARLVGSDHTFGGNVVHAACDHGRAVYVVDGFRSTAMAVVPDASECRTQPNDRSEATNGGQNNQSGMNENE